MIKWFVKKYLKSILNDLLEKAQSKTDLAKLAATIKAYVWKLEQLIAFLKSLTDKVADAELTDDEIDALENEGTTLIKDIMK